MGTVSYRSANVDGLKIFYREAGRTDAPALLLLHGFPTSSHMFRNFIPLLADRFHVVAPDLPGFGQSDMPSRDAFPYTFAKLAEVIGRFTEAVNLKRFAIYIFDYGAPVGLRIAVKHPDRITAIVSQNGNAYQEGLSDGWNPIRTYWREPTKANRDALRSFLSPETTFWQYTHGVADPSLVSPDGYSLDDFYLARPGAHEPQLDLFLDYASNVALYPNSRPTSVIVSRLCWPCGDATIRFSCRQGPKPTDATSLVRISAFSTPVTSRWRRITRKSPWSFATSWIEWREQRPEGRRQHCWRRSRARRIPDDRRAVEYGHGT
jgi:pimeloyl-ACP methyl ester carboxylesterase